MRCRILIVAVGALVTAPSASADIDIDEISRKTARPGEPVRVTAAGFVGATAWVAPIVMFPAHRASRQSRLMRYRDLLRPPYRLVGTIRRWQGRTRNGHAWGAVVFHTPRVRPGLYIFGMFCPPCARGPRGSLIVDPALTLQVLT